MSNSPKHLLASSDLQPDEIRDLIALARRLKANPQPVLAGVELALLFEKPSLRTRMSFEVGMRRLGGDAVYMAPQEVGIGEREAIKDVARAVARYVDIVAFRTFGQANIEEYAKFSSVPVINALTEEEHPCQALADLLTLTEHMGDVAGRSLAYVGDGNNVAASLVTTAASLGMHVRIASPPGYGLPEHVAGEASMRAQASGGSFTTLTAPDEAIRDAEAVYTDVWTSMGQERETERRRLAFEGYQVDRTLLNYAASGAYVMHDLPAHRGEEITEDAIESPNSIIFDQAENRLWAQAAVVVSLLGLEDSITN